MSTGVFLAVLLAAAMHAGWNAVLKVKLEPFIAMTLVTGLAGVIGLPFLLALGPPRVEAWPWLLGSVAIHLAYYLALSEAYRHADMGQVYPIARGAAPLLTTIASLVLIREPIAPVAGIGIGVLASGIGLMSLRGKGGHFDRRAVGFALLTSVIICGYTIVDGIGARVAGDPHAYSAALFVVDAIPLPLYLLWRRGRAAFAPMRQFLVPGFAGAGMSLAAYWIAIWAMTVAPIALVAALRETSVLFATLIAVLLLKEPLVPARGVAALLIVAGIITIKVA
jgi:drug/metabolite transporter (DMT)-like permease